MQHLKYVKCKDMKWRMIVTFLAFFSLRLCLALLTGSSSISAAAASYEMKTNLTQVQTDMFKWAFMEFSVFSGQKRWLQQTQKNESHCVDHHRREASLIYWCFNLRWRFDYSTLTWACCVCVCAESCSSSSGTESSLSDSVPDPRGGKNIPNSFTHLIMKQIIPGE